MSQPLTRQQSASTPAPLSKADALGPIARAVLRGAARGLCYERGGFQAAELWLLDNASAHLNLAARWTRSQSALAEDPKNRRPLADAPADVAALAGGAVVLENRDEAAAWDFHSPASSAIGVPVSSDSTIHGVLWLLAESEMALADEPVELAEVVAGRLALEVEAKGGHVTLDAPEPPGSDPPPTPLVEAETNLSFASTAPVEAAGWHAPHTEGLSASGCFKLADGRLFTISATAIDSPESSTASQRSAVEWLMEEAPRAAARVDDAGVLLTVLNRRLQEAPLAGEGLAVAAALVDPPEDADAGIGGCGTYALAGPTVALSVRAAATDSHAGDLVPLGWSEPQAAYAPRPFELAIRQRLILVAGDPRLTSPLVERRLGDAFRAATADAHREMTAEACLRRLATAGAEQALAAVVLRRE